jgi:hypothetical protein
MAGMSDLRPWWGMLGAISGSVLEPPLLRLVESGELPADLPGQWAAGLWLGLRAGPFDVGPAREPAWARGLPPDCLRVAVATALCWRHHGGTLDATAWWTVLHRLDRQDGWSEALERARHGADAEADLPPLVRALSVVPDPLRSSPAGDEPDAVLAAALAGILRGASSSPSPGWQQLVEQAISAIERELASRRHAEESDDTVVDARLARPDFPLASPWYALPSVVSGSPLWMRGDRQTGLVVWLPGQEVEVPPLAFEEVRRRFAGSTRFRLASHREARESSGLGGFLRRLTGFNSAAWVAARLVADGWIGIELEQARAWVVPLDAMGPPVEGAAKV